MKIDEAGLEALFHAGTDLAESEWPSLAEKLPADQQERLLQMLQSDRTLQNSKDEFLDTSVADPGMTWPASIPDTLNSTILGNVRDIESEHPEQIGDYRILNVIAVHGQGIVYRADHIHLNRQVVIKVSKDRLDPNARRALFDEGKSLASLSHPNIAQVFDLRIENQFPCLVMEYIEGQNLADRHGTTPVAPPEAAKLVQQMCDGMQHAHSKGIIHRDLKPANVVIRASDDHPMIIDFGLARVRSAFSPDLSDTTYGGTIAYMPPEQAKMLIDQMKGSKSDDQTSKRSDVFALGAILFTLLTGSRPYLFSNNQEGLEKAVECDFDRKLLDRPGIPVAIRNCCLKAMSKRPEDRFASASQFADALGAAVAAPWWRIPAAVIALSLVSITAWISWPTPEPPNAPPSNSTLNPAIVEPSQSPTGAEIEFTHFSNTSDDSRITGELFRNGPVKENDDLRLDAVFTDPTYFMLIAINPDTSVQLCYPDRGDIAQSQPKMEFHYPQDKAFAFGFTDGAGQQAFLLLSDSSPLPTFDELMASMGQVDSALQNVTGDWIWNAGELSPAMTFGGQTRGNVRSLRGHEGFSAVCEQLQSRHPSMKVHAVTFSVATR